MTEKNIQSGSKTKLMALTGMMTAMTVIFTAYIFHIPVGMNGGYIHFGDSVIYLAAAFLPFPYALIVGALGGGIADLLTAPMWTIATMIIKMLIVLPFSSKSKRFLSKRNLLAPVIAFFISATGYYIAEMILFGSKTAIISAFSGSLIQSGGSALFFYIAGAAFDGAGIKKTVLKYTT
ncbi:TIGR04002 family protein [Butyrivibrio sp. X503]|uniref:TIGR04002 family protein n=1 Tax=Butyrivibrio sp. X503 TaxID=2364878 RepID=UPI000EA9CCA1|nr:TIGR04002 family protein [Butyrivibrio sp. X503]RKM54109.1 TIGR04002 family protein [Butyrivibrio sp. X503]